MVTVNSWWRHDMDTFCPFVRGIHRWPVIASKAVRWCFPWCWPGQSVELAVQLPVFWDAMPIMWRQCNINTLQDGECLMGCWKYRRCYPYTWKDGLSINSLRPRWNKRHFADDIFKCIFLNENILISSKIPLKFIANDPINNIPALVQIMAWCRPCRRQAIIWTYDDYFRPQWVTIRPKWTSPVCLIRYESASYTGHTHYILLDCDISCWKTRVI